MALTDDQWMSALHDTGEAFDNDFDEGLGGIFEFSITVPGDSNHPSTPVLTASFERALSEHEPREGNGDYAKRETRRWMLVPFDHTSGGVALTGPVLDKLAEEAEEGYPVEKLRPRSAGQE